MSTDMKVRLARLRKLNVFSVLEVLGVVRMALTQNSL